MPRNPKGEMNLSEIRNLARQHNKLSQITGIGTKSRSALIAEITKMGYRVDHSKKAIIRNRKAVGSRIGHRVSKKGEAKPQKRTIRKRAREQLKKGGAAPVYVADRGEEEI